METDGKKMFATRLNPDLLKKLKHLSIDMDKSIADLIAEAIQDLFKKYEGKQALSKKK